MDEANLEFIALLQRSKWNQSEAARKLELPPASVSRYVNGIDKPAKQTLRLFRLLLIEEQPQLLASAAPLRDQPAKYLAAAERALARLPEAERNEVIKLVDQMVNYATRKQRKPSPQPRHDQRH